MYINYISRNNNYLDNGFMLVQRSDFFVLNDLSFRRKFTTLIEGKFFFKEISLHYFLCSEFFFFSFRFALKIFFKKNTLLNSHFAQNNELLNTEKIELESFICAQALLYYLFV